jgi:hypothetical protein
MFMFFHSKLERSWPIRPAIIAATIVVAGCGEPAVQTVTTPPAPGGTRARINSFGEKAGPAGKAQPKTH